MTHMGEKIKTPVVLVHSGSLFPTCLNDCISLLKRSEVEVHLILPKDLHHLVLHEDIILEDLENFKDESYRSYNITNFNTEFRDNFYSRTSSRFFILHNYAKSKGLESFFHIENDIALFSDLIHERSVAEQLGKQMSLVIDADRCVPSIIWFKDHSIIEAVCDFIFNNNSFTDMQNLYHFFTHYQYLVSNFPILPEASEYNNFNIKYDSNFNDYGSIFDGAALGQYFFGIDNVQDPSDKKIGFINETTVFKACDYQYIWKDGQPYILDGSALPVKINNLHMHCKDIKQLL